MLDWSRDDESRDDESRVEGVISFDPQQIIWQDGKAYLICPKCGALVRLNKPVFGSLHFCSG